jgi:hypothetical protein
MTRETSKGEPLFTPAETAEQLDMSRKLLLAHVHAGDIRYLNTGVGKVRKRRHFTRYMMEQFLIKRKEKETPAMLQAPRH